MKLSHRLNGSLDLFIFAEDIHLNIKLPRATLLLLLVLSTALFESSAKAIESQSACPVPTSLQTLPLYMNCLFDRAINDSNDPSNVPSYADSGESPDPAFSADDSTEVADVQPIEEAEEHEHYYRRTQMTCADPYDTGNAPSFDKTTGPFCSCVDDHQAECAKNRGHLNAILNQPVPDDVCAELEAQGFDCPPTVGAIYGCWITCRKVDITPQPGSC